MTVDSARLDESIIIDLEFTFVLAGTKQSRARNFGQLFYNIQYDPIEKTADHCCKSTNNNGYCSKTYIDTNSTANESSVASLLLAEVA